MRGLTSAERRELTSWVSGIPPFDVEVMQGLVASGRVTFCAERNCWDRTNMAHLALRVCPAGEP